jgi:hypothetical protein
VGVAKKPSTALRRRADAGVKWNVHREWRSSHRRTLGCLWAAQLSTMAWIVFPHGDLFLDDIEETDELLMAMALHIPADHGADASCCEATSALS